MSTSFAITKLLLERGADVNAKNNDGMTALMRCCKMGGDKNAGIATLLLRAGANVNSVNTDKESALSLTKANVIESKGLEELLLAWGAKEVEVKQEKCTCPACSGIGVVQMLQRIMLEEVTRVLENDDDDEDKDDFGEDDEDDEEDDEDGGDDDESNGSVNFLEVD